MDNCSTMIQTMEDSLFPYLDGGYSSNTSHRYMSNGEEQSDLEADSMPESTIELTEADVYTQLEHKERDLILAAELGKSLLEKNEELSRENDRLQQQFHDRIEALEQEKHELRQRLEFKSSENEANLAQFNSDIMRTQDELEERKAMLIAAEREKTRAVEELSEQNQKLITQLQLASDAEIQLSAQVQQLRREFLERSSSANVKILQLESLKEEIAQDTESRVELEDNYHVMRDESNQLRDELSSTSDRLHHAERLLHERERELKRVVMELKDAHSCNRQLQIRVDELREEMSLQISLNSHGNSSSLLSELEESVVDHSDVFDFTTHTASSPNDAGSPDLENNLQDNNNTQDEEIQPDIRCFGALMNSINNCHHQLFELKQDMWDSYQRIQTISACLRTFLNKQSSTEPTSPSSGGSTNLSKAIEELSNIAQEVVRLKVICESPDSDIVRMLKEQHLAVTQERDDAVAAKKALEVNLARTKVDLMAVNSQLLEAIQQKLRQQTELEAWQDDMEQMIQKGLADRTNKRAQTSDSPPTTKTSWFSFRRARSNSGESATSSIGDVTSSRKTSPACERKSTQPNESRFSSWMRRKQTTESQRDVTDNDVTT